MRTLKKKNEKKVYEVKIDFKNQSSLELELGIVKMLKKISSISPSELELKLLEVLDNCLSDQINASYFFESHSKARVLVKVLKKCSSMYNYSIYSYRRNLA